MLNNLNWLIMVSFGVSATTAGTIVTIIVRAGATGMSMSRMIALIAVTGVGAIVVGGISAVGFWWLSNYIKSNGEAALIQW
ncbi:hypothetical protein ACFQZ1_10020 [Bacillus sp. CGMCC 1.60114]|uniref:hypothetical protein n=1 Tax=unclassified Bacillus (in: firmicutes) TaxID=185979 RepID=UPI00363B37D3